MDTQTKQILDWLESGRSITPLDALRLCGCFRLSARIYDLRKMGVEIDAGKKYITAANGTRKKVAEYSLKKTEVNK